MINKRTRARLDRFLQERNEHPEHAAEIDAQIAKVFGESLAILVMDMSGFSRQTLRFGIIHFLAQIHRMQAIAAPVIEAHQGELIKHEADNIYVVFPEVEQAVDAALDLDGKFEAANTMLADQFDIHGEFGIGYGEILVVENDDIFGAEVNLSSKLGEDLAQRGEILLTMSAYERVNKTAHEYEELKLSVSGIEVVAYKVRKAAKLDQA